MAAAERSGAGHGCWSREWGIQDAFEPVEHLRKVGCAEAYPSRARQSQWLPVGMWACVHGALCAAVVRAARGVPMSEKAFSL